MKHFISLVFKFLLVSIVLAVVLMLLTPVDLIDVLYISLVLTIVSYIIGDLIILPMTNNFIATVTDAVIGVITIMLFNYAIIKENIYFSAALIASIVLAAGEWFFHKYVSIAVISDRNENDDLSRDEMRR